MKSRHSFRHKARSILIEYVIYFIFRSFIFYNRKFYFLPLISFFFSLKKTKYLENRPFHEHNSRTEALSKLSMQITRSNKRHGPWCIGIESFYSLGSEPDGRLKILEQRMTECTARFTQLSVGNSTLSFFFLLNKYIFFLFFYFYSLCNSFFSTVTVVFPMRALMRTVNSLENAPLRLMQIITFMHIYMCPCIYIYTYSCTYNASVIYNDTLLK